MSKCEYCEDSSIGCMDIPGKGKICICNKDSCQEHALNAYNNSLPAYQKKVI